MIELAAFVFLIPFFFAAAVITVWVIIGIFVLPFMYLNSLLGVIFPRHPLPNISGNRKTPR